ncbi:hypothetical protein CO651_26770 [Rhizobium phaseoli]|nr:hypothetical protein CO651_26770 [Rhizobium phaseoli]
MKAIRYSVAVGENALMLAFTITCTISHEPLEIIGWGMSWQGQANVDIIGKDQKFLCFEEMQTPNDLDHHAIKSLVFKVKPKLARGQ